MTKPKIESTPGYLEEGDDMTTLRERAAEEWARERLGDGFYEESRARIIRVDAFLAGWTACEAKQAERIGELEAKVKTFTLRIAKAEGREE